MNTSPLPVKALALALCLSLPASSFAASLSRSGPLHVSGGATAFAAELRLLEPELERSLQTHFRAEAPAGSSLAGMRAAAVAGPSAPQAAALALIARAAQAGPDAAFAALSKAGLPGDLAARVAAAATMLQRAAESDPVFARELASAQRELEGSATDKARSRVPRMLERLRSAFSPNRPSAQLAGVAAGPAGPGSNGPRPSGLGKPTPHLAKSLSADPASSEAVNPSQVPSSKKVSELLALAKTDKAAAVLAAESLLADKTERRLEVRMSAIRIIQQHAPPGAIGAFTALLKNDANWYIRREAARSLGLRAAAVQEGREVIVALLREAYKSSNDSLRLMAAWAIREYGADPGKEPIVSEPKEKAVSSPRRASSAEPQKPKPSLFKRLILVGLALSLATLMFSNSNRPRPPQPDARPAAVSQVGPASNDRAPSATASAAVAAPQPTEIASLDEIARETKRTADAVESLAQAAEKAQQKPGAGRALGGMVLNVLLLVGVFMLVMWIVGKMRGGGGGMGGAGSIRGQLSQTKNRIEQTTTRFSDVAGIDDAMGEIQEIVDYLRNPLKYRRLGGRVPRGVLLEGPPGTGKTLLAKALATESGANFLSVSGSDFIEMFVGVGASRVRELFTLAKKNTPSIIFIDELDAVAKRRDSGKFSGNNDEREQTVNAILTEMGGFETSSGVIVLAATNRSDVLDPAITRPGRFDRKIHVGLPDILGREAILQVHARRARLSPEADLRFIAQRTAGLSGAFLENVVNEAALLAARRGGDSISQADLNEAVDRNTVGAKRNLFVPADLKRRIAVHEIGHALAGMLAGGKRPNRVTIIPHGANALGWAESGGEDDRYLYTQVELEAMLVGILGGLTAEKIVYGHASTGPDNDLEKATNIARMMVERLGMSELVGYAQASPDPANPMAGRRVSEQTAREIDLEVKRILDEAQAKAMAFLTQRRAAFDGSVAEILERETISGEELERIVNERK